MDTATCPRCHQPVNPQAVTCPHCRTELKAYGHPGIPLHRASGEGYLCDSCTYHADDTCNFPQRPYAKECILYQNLEESKLQIQQQGYTISLGATIRGWVRRHRALLLLLGLLFICFLIVLATSWHKSRDVIINVSTLDGSNTYISQSWEMMQKKHTCAVLAMAIASSGWEKILVNAQILPVKKMLGKVCFRSALKSILDCT